MTLHDSIKNQILCCIDDGLSTLILPHNWICILMNVLFPLKQEFLHSLPDKISKYKIIVKHRVIYFEYSDYDGNSDVVKVFYRKHINKRCKQVMLPPIKERWEYFLSD